jgi:EmrB/QacA subfamily drug resistance transporter
MKLAIQDSAAPDDEARTTTSNGWVLTSLALCTLLPSLGTSIANVALPTLAQSFGASFQQVQWVVLAYLLAMTTLMVSVGRLGDILGRRRLLLAGISLFTAASCLCGAAPGLWWLVAARAGQGLGAAMMMALTMALVSEAVPKSKTGSAMGMLGTMSAVGTALGPSLGGVLIAGLGWQAIFFVNVPLGILALWLVRRWLSSDRPKAGMDRRVGFDFVGTLLLATTLGAYALAMTVGRGSFGSANMTLLAATALGLGLFVWSQAKVSSPLIRLTLFRKPGLSASLAMSALVSTVMMATLVVGPFYLTRALNLDAAWVGVIMSVGPAISALTGVPAGRVVDRFGAQRMALSGLAGMVAGCVVLCMAPTMWGIAGYVIPIAIVTAHYALFQAANNTAVMAGVSADQRGVVSGVVNLSRNLGLITGASALGAVFAFASKASTATTAGPEAVAVAVGMRVTFSVAVALLVVALIIGFASHALSRRVTLPHQRNTLR